MKYFGFSNFTNESHFAQIPDKLFLADNLDECYLDVWHQEMFIGQSVQVKMGMFFLCLEGSLRFEINHRYVEAVSGQCVLILTDSFFQYLGRTAGTKFVFIAIAPHFVDSSKDVQLGLEFREIVQERCVMNLPPMSMEEFLSLYKVLKRKLLDSSYVFKEEVARSILSVFEFNTFSNFIRYRQNAVYEQPQQTRRNEMFRRYIDAVKEHFMEERSVSFYARQLGVTPKHLSTVIKEVSGRHASDFINIFVINECKALLHEENISVKEVCSRMNFSNNSFFAKYFKQHTGMTPIEYKQKIHNFVIVND